MVSVIKWSEFSVNSVKDGEQEGVQLHALSNGQFMAVWEHQNGAVSTIYAQRFYSGAAPAGPQIQINTSSGEHSKPVMTVLSDGRILYVWQNIDATSAEPNRILGRIFGADGNPVDDDFVIASSAAPLQTPKVIADKNGGFAVNYTEGDASSGPRGADAKIAFFDETGTAYGGESFATFSEEKSAGLIALDDNIFVSFVTDSSLGSEVSHTLRAQIIIADGTTVTNRGAWTWSIEYAKNTSPSAAALHDGRVVVTWTTPSSSGTGHDIMAQVLEVNSDGTSTLVGTPITVSANVGNQTSPSVTMLRQGGFAISYLDSSEPGAARVMVAVYDENRNAVATQIVANESDVPAGLRFAPTLIELRDGRLIASWNENIPTSPHDPSGIRGRVIDARFKGFQDDGSDANDQLIGSALGDTLSGGAFGNDELLGRDGNDKLYGGSGTGLGDDTLDGGAGVDTMEGGVGNDTYHVDNTADVIVELAGGGTDLVKTTASYTLSDHVENILAEGTNAINLTGNALDNTITGNAAANVLKGGLGNDTYYADNLDTIVEGAGEGTDRVITSFSHTLAANVENLTAVGTAAITLTGNGLANTINGNSANNTINGGDGNDTMAGGLGDDTYYVGSAGDRVTELAGQGTDKIIVGFNYTLGDNIENLQATGSGNLTLTGNSLNNNIEGNSGANTIIGGAGNDTLDGGTGADRMEGGNDSDTYYVDNAKDVVVEGKGGGYYDQVVTKINYTLGTNVEWGWIFSAKGLTLTGNSVNNHLNGNVGNDKLNGGAGNDTLVGASGADTMTGGTGNDSYFVDNKKDKVIETANGGKADMVTTGISYTLGAYVENLTGAGSSALSLTGNSLNNKIVGNDGKSTIKGQAGNDIIDGGYGNDVLYGGSGKDSFVFSKGFDRGSNVDTIKDFSVKDDTIRLDNAIFKSLVKTGKLNKSFFTIGPKAKGADDYIIYDNKKGILYYDADGSGAGAAIKIATLGKKLKMTHADFLVI
ncbi:hypothetical protein MHY87_06250 [Microvirga sp. ACRRW]|uniref:calcium-binding protein n=1 Tax=Microvirga sp. ACRRW TaxID=2918205 RepID=UPI001EF69582|nr:calcium-binding protein [Microvirga sp. ACRRW]MCG7392502.1 hypothetical protein [Microvirga sp. ACRRW]